MSGGGVVHVVLCHTFFIYFPPLFLSLLSFLSLQKYKREGKKDKQYTDEIYYT